MAATQMNKVVYQIRAKLVFSTVTAACVSAVGEVAAKAFVSAKVIALTEGVLQSMLLTKGKSAIAVLLVLGIAALDAGGLICTTLATEPPPATADKKDQGQANLADMHDRVLELKQQLDQMQKKIAKLEQDTQAKHNEGSTDVTALANRFKYKVPFEIGDTEFKEGGRIEIREVWGTRPKIEVGGQYLVRGKYVLPRGERGMLYFYETAEGNWAGATANMDLQWTALDKKEGEFTLVHGMAGPGYFHLYLSAEERYSRTFANVYFGTGDKVSRKKP